VRVRSVQVHDRPVARADAGQRVALALPGVERHELRRGDALVAAGAYVPSFRLDVALDALHEIPPRVQVHHGTATVLARVVRVGERWAQLRLAEPVVAARGDRVVLRAETTVGGGRVLDPAPPRHASAERMAAVERGESFVHAPVPAAELRRIGAEVEGDWAYSPAWLDELRAELEREIDAADPLDPGVPVPSEPWAEAIVPLLGFERRGAKLYRPGATAELGGREAAARELEAQLGLEPVKVADPALARYLEAEGRLVRLGDSSAVSHAAYEQASALLTDGITLAEFRDALGVGRKAAQLYLERFDADGLTRRVGDARVLRRRRERP
jgi:selenocysteine-specific elongation factor